MFLILDLMLFLQNATIRTPTIAKWWNLAYCSCSICWSFKPSRTASMMASTLSLSWPLKMFYAFKGRVSWKPAMKMSGRCLTFDDRTISSNQSYWEGAFPARFQVKIPSEYSFIFENSSSFFINWFSISIFAFEVDKLCLESIKSMHSYLSSSLLDSVFL